ncbi:MAG: hypothetical protein Q7J68_02875, partial [Thermoplasmata archaeon]|nr:hypothetical protein [Thermoplasmata archaeon]
MLDVGIHAFGNIKDLEVAVGDLVPAILGNAGISDSTIVNIAERIPSQHRMSDMVSSADEPVTAAFVADSVELRNIGGAARAVEVGNWEVADTVAFAPDMAV